MNPDDTLPFRHAQGWLQVPGGDYSRHLPLPRQGSLPAAAHLFTASQVHAINAALATGRPILVRGEPGVGKSQLARAAAVALGRPFIHQTVDARTEAHELLWRRDDVARLGTAQVLGVLKDGAKPLELLDVRCFIRPGALWWALDPAGAAGWAKKHPMRVGCGDAVLDSCGADRVDPPVASPESASESVVLVDEIDKADPSVPSALLDALGQGGFTVPGVGRVSCTTDEASVLGVPERAIPRLIIFTTNNQRVLPDAFLRRCLVLRLSMPEGQSARGWLLKRGRAVFGDADATLVAAMDEAAGLVTDHRVKLGVHVEARPGLSEFLDLTRALSGAREAGMDTVGLVDDLKRVVLDKKRVPTLAAPVPVEPTAESEPS